MDGQLDPDQQQRVESALAASPQLAEKLRGLTLVRDMVASLPQDGSVDVRARVMQQIQARRRQRGFLPTLEGWRHGSRRILPLAGLAATAATLMVAARWRFLLQTSQLDRAPGRSLRFPRRGRCAGRVAPPIPVSVDGHRAISNCPKPLLPHPIPTSPAALAGRTVSPARQWRSDRGRTRQSRRDRTCASKAVSNISGRFLDNPSLKRFFLVQGGPKTTRSRRWRASSSTRPVSTSSRSRFRRAS